MSTRVALGVKRSGNLNYARQNHCQRHMLVFSHTSECLAVAGLCCSAVSSHWPSELKIKLVLLKSELFQSEQSADRGGPSAWKPGLVLQCLIWRRPLKAFRSQTQVLLEKIAAVSFMCRSHLDQIKASSSRLFSDVAVFAFSQSGDDITVLLLWFSWEFFLFFSCLSLILCYWTLFEVLMCLLTIIMSKYNTSGDLFFIFYFFWNCTCFFKP